MINRPLISLRSRRCPRYSAYTCAAATALLLLLSISFLCSCLSHQNHSLLLRRRNPGTVSLADPLISDDSQDEDAAVAVDDRIDELDDVVFKDSPRNDEPLEDDDDEKISDKNRLGVSGFFYNHVNGAIRRRFNGRSIDDWDDDYLGFGSDDAPMKL